jgi:nicotinamide-nucleotide amidase
MATIKELMLIRPRLTLAVAESMTCGRVQAQIGKISGASRFFIGGITTYTLDQKVRHLGVSRVAASAVNCVSAEVAEQMARGACAFFSASLGVATTGYAEPEPEWDVAEPFAWWAVAHRQRTGRFGVRSGRVDCPGAPRVLAQEIAAAAALSALEEFLKSLRRRR